MTGGIQYGGLVDVRDVVHDVALHAKHIPADAMEMLAQGHSRRIPTRSSSSGVGCVLT